MHVGELTRPGLIFPRLQATSREALLRVLADRLAAAGEIADADRLFEKLLEREQLGSTGIGGGVAIPHCKVKALQRVVLAVGIAEAAIDFDATDGEPVQVFFLLASPESAPADHLKALAAISQWIKADRHVERMLALAEASEIFALLNEEAAP